MASHSYIVLVKDAQGSLLRQQRHATDINELKQQLTHDNLALVHIQPQQQIYNQLLRLFGGSRTKQRFNLVLFSRELESLLLSGLTIVEAMHILSSRQHIHSNIATQLTDKLEQGYTFSRALKEFPETIFPPLYIGMIASSEQTSNLPEALSQFIVYEETAHALRTKLINALVYPSILMSVGLLVISFLLIYLAPKFHTIYQQVNIKSSGITQLLIMWGQFVNHHQPAIIAIILLACISVIYGFKNPRLRTLVFHWITQLPWLHGILHVVFCTRFYRTIALLLRGGHTIIEALRLSKPVLPPHYQSRVDMTILVITQGHSVSQAFKQNNLVTDIALPMLTSGERTGRMRNMLEHISHFHEREVSEKIDKITRLIEPIIMLVMGIIVGAIVIAMYLPIFEIAGQL